jgi:hypothetical protein
MGFDGVTDAVVDEHAVKQTLPGDDTKHEINVGTQKFKITIKGNARTAVLGAGLLIIVGSFVEMR